MKILMVLDRTFPSDIRVEHEITSLTKAGHTVHLACFTFIDEPLEDYWNGIKIHRKKISSFIHKTSVGCLKFPFYFNFWRSFLNKINKKYHFDAVHIHDLPLAKLGQELKKERSIRFVLDLHENWPALLSIAEHVQGPLGKLLSSPKQWRVYEKQMIENADDVIVVVEESKKRIQSFTDNPDKIHIVSNTPVLSELKNLRKTKAEKNDSLILFYGGGVTKHRGLQAVIEVLAKIEHKDIEFWIVGDGSYLENLKQLSIELKVKDQIRFLGWKTLNELTELMLKSDVLVIPHKKSEHTDSTIPHKLFQYMLTGKPILATNCIPIERIIKETNSGFIYNFEDPESFKKKVNYIYNKWSNNENLAMDGIKPVLEKYNWATDEKTLLNIYAD
ncbi:MAG: glycosyltransferase family 4 protein [Balneolaceae bacterium]